MLQQKKNWQSGVDAKQGASIMRGKQATYNGLSAEQKKAYAATFATEEEFFRAIGLLD
jgi:hypothetical protein